MAKLFNLNEDTTDDSGSFDFGLGMLEIDPLSVILPIFEIGTYLFYKGV